MIYDLSRLDTRPGATGEYAVLAPPEDFNGNAEDYAQWLRASFKQNPLIRQVMGVLTRAGQSPNAMTFPRIEGPYAEALIDTLARLTTQLRERAALREAEKKANAA